MAGNFSIPWGGGVNIGLRGFWIRDHTDSNGPMHLLDHHQFSTSVSPGLNFLARDYECLELSLIFILVFWTIRPSSPRNGEMACFERRFWIHRSGFSLKAIKTERIVFEQGFYN